MQDQIGADDKIVQSVHLDKKIFPTYEVAKAVVQSLRLSVSAPSETINTWRFQQQSPKLFVKGSFRTRNHSNGIRIIVGDHLPGLFAGWQARRLK